MDIFIQLLGWLGSIALACCGLPIVFSALKDRSIAKNLPILFLNLWFWGELLIMLYAAMLGKDLAPVFFNCVINIVCIMAVLWIRWRDQ